MQNVIFNGSSGRKPQGMAEVSLTIENNRDVLPIEYTSITITRRLYRSGESEYLLNGKTCRLRDIIDLFMDTGMGAGAYSVIELKMVEEILNDKNNDRRKLFEEAAGVTRYKEKRRQTLKKLDETIADLTRVEDILVEIRKKARSLQLQANKAQRAKEYSEQLEHLDLAWSRYEYQRLQDELVPLHEKQVEAEKEKQDLQQQIGSLEEEETLAREKQESLEQELITARKEAGRIEAAIREIETTIRINTEKIQNEKQVILNFENDINQAESDISDQKRKQVAARTTLENRKAELEQAVAELGKYREIHQSIENEVSQCRKQVAQASTERENLGTQINQLQSKKIRLESRLESFQEDIARLQAQKDEIDEQLFNRAEEIKGLQEKGKTLATAVEDARLALEEIKSTRQDIHNRINELRDVLREKKAQRDGLASEKELLEGIAKSHDSFPGSVQFLLKFKKEFGLMEVVTDVLSVESNLAVALEAALGEACNYLVVEHAVDAQLAFKKLRDGKKGRAAIIPADLIETIKAEVHPESIAHKTNCEKRFTKLRDVLLGRVCLVNSIDEGVKKAGENLTCVTPAGDVVTSAGVIRSGSPEKNIGIRVGLKDRLKTLEEEIARTEEDIRRNQATMEELSRKLSMLNEQQAVEELGSAEKKHREAEQQLRTLQSQEEMMKRSLSEIQARNETLEKDARLAKDEIGGIDPEIAQLNGRIEKLIEEQLGLRNQLREKEEALVRAQQSMNDARVREQRLRSEAESYEREMQQAENAVNVIKQRLDQRAALAKASHGKIGQLTDETTQGREKLAALTEEKRAADQVLNETDERTGKQRGKIRSLEEQIRQIQRKKEINAELLHQFEMQKSRLDMQVKAVLDHVWETYGKLIEQVNEELPEGTEPGTVKSTIQSLRERLKSIGEVNHLAIDEYKEEKERLDFYEDQVQDLIEAEQKLRNTIKEINKTANERFTETFSRIRENFIKVFNMLFQEDDHCDLVLQDNSDDPLDQKIEIIAKPRGKRPTNIEQLSGGEKTLTAIALLFAIYLVKPSPFCILDEVDAPLDDANIERFTNLLKQFSGETQFIVITHNKKTMNKSEVMYGVTMPETGVSKLVGVRLDDSKMAS